MRAVIQVAASLLSPVLGAIVSGAMTAAAGGSLADAFKAVAFSIAQMAIFRVVGTIVQSAHAIVQASVHGVVSGAINVIRGSNFLQGFAGGFIGKIGSVITRGIENFAFRTAVAAGFGCAGAAASGGKCVNGAVTAAYAHFYNEMSQPADLRGQAHYMMDAEAGAESRVISNPHDVRGTFAQGVGFMACGTGASPFLGWAGRATASILGLCSFRGYTEKRAAVCSPFAICVPVGIRCGRAMSTPAK